MKDAFLFTIELLDATAVEGIFPISNWSLEGSNRYKREKKTATHWRDLLQDLEGNAERYNMSAHHSVSLVCASCNNLYVYQQRHVIVNCIVFANFVSVLHVILQLQCFN